MTKSEIFVNRNGLSKLAKVLAGDETIHIGIRPYELHAGNKLAIIAYPILLCRELERLGKEPRLTLLLSLNDWEQRVLAGTDIYKYTFDVRPLDITIQYAKEKDNKTLTAPLWGQRIIDAMSDITQRYPHVTITPYYNSALHQHEAMKSVVLQTLRNSPEIKDLMLSITGKPTDNSSALFASTVCSECHDANTHTEIVEEKLSVSCTTCTYKSIGKYEDFMYWLHHKPLFAARWKALGFNYSLSGGDHLAEGDVEVRRSLFEYYFKEKPPKLGMIFSPILLGSDGNKMSKSRGNYFDLPTEDLLLLAESNEPRLSVTAKYTELK